MAKLVIFDCDGTLVDSELLCNQGLSEQLASIGVDISGDELVRRFRGVEFDVILQALITERGFSVPENFEADYRQTVTRLFDQHLQPIEGASAVLSQLKTTKCVASSAPRTKIEQSLTVTGLRSYFGNEIFSCYDIGVWKPQPDIFLHAAKVMSVQPEECCVIEDSDVGVAAALAAGMTCFHYRPHGHLKSVHGEIPFRHMNELLELVQNHTGSILESR